MSSPINHSSMVRVCISVASPVPPRRAVAPAARQRRRRAQEPLVKCAWDPFDYAPRPGRILHNWHAPLEMVNDINACLAAKRVPDTVVPLHVSIYSNGPFARDYNADEFAELIVTIAYGVRFMIDQHALHTESANPMKQCDSCGVTPCALACAQQFVRDTSNRVRRSRKLFVRAAFPSKQLLESAHDDLFVPRSPPGVPVDQRFVTRRVERICVTIQVPDISSMEVITALGDTGECAFTTAHLLTYVARRLVRDPQMMEATRLIDECDDRDAASMPASSQSQSSPPPPPPPSLQSPTASRAHSIVVPRTPTPPRRRAPHKTWLPCDNFPADSDPTQPHVTDHTVALETSCRYFQFTRALTTITRAMFAAHTSQQNQRSASQPRELSLVDVGLVAVRDAIARAWCSSANGLSPLCDEYESGAYVRMAFEAAVGVRREETFGPAGSGRIRGLPPYAFYALRPGMPGWKQYYVYAPLPLLRTPNDAAAAAAVPSDAAPPSGADVGVPPDDLDALERVPATPTEEVVAQRPRTPPTRLRTPVSPIGAAHAAAATDTVLDGVKRKLAFAVKKIKELTRDLAEVTGSVDPEPALKRQRGGNEGDTERADAADEKAVAAATTAADANDGEGKDDDEEEEDDEDEDDEDEEDEDEEGQLYDEWLQEWNGVWDDGWYAPTPPAHSPVTGAPQV